MGALAKQLKEAKEEYFDTFNLNHPSGTRERLVHGTATNNSRASATSDSNKHVVKHLEPVGLVDQMAGVVLIHSLDSQPCG